MKRIATLVLIVSLLGLVWFSHRLAGIRIYQVDECENVYVAKVLAAGQVKSSYAFVSLLHFPLAWLSRGATQAVDCFVAARFLMLEVFWFNVVLIALATGEKLFSLRGLWALVGAATLAPLWDYGFEIRHDNLLLTGILLLWCVARVRPNGVQSYIICGALAVALQFVAFKAFVYTIPISLAIMAFPPKGYTAPRWKLALGWTSGALVVFVLLRIAYGQAGAWDLFISDIHRVSGDASARNRFAPSITLARLLTQTPLLIAVTSAAVLAVFLDLRRRLQVAVAWDGNMPEVFLFLVVTAALLINPTPFPYNLVLFVPFAYLVGFRYCTLLWDEAARRTLLIPGVISVLLFTHFVPFAIATRRHVLWTNYRQERLMRLAEDLTNPSSDPVYDGVGMVPTRPSIHFWWLLHSFIIDKFTKGTGPRVREMLAAKPAAVIIPNYRTDWLPEEDHDFIRDRYVSLADDFWVLGKILPAGGATFEIFHAGRYRISTLNGSDLADTYPLGLKGMATPEDPGTLRGSLDGAPLSNKAVQLDIGVHRIECAPDCQPAVVWVGPRLDRVHRIGPGDHTVLFYNWY
jgi:hypothetical protein